MARLAGFEPATYGFEVRYSIQLNYRRIIQKFGASDGTLTRDHWSHNPVLYQLSYARRFTYNNIKLSGKVSEFNGLPPRCKTKFYLNF